MQLALALCISSLLVLRTLCFEEGVDNAKQHNKQILALSRKERDKNWFYNLMAQDKEAPMKNLRSAIDLNADFPNVREMLYGVNVLKGKPPSETSFGNKILNFDYTDNSDNSAYWDVNRDHSCGGGSYEEEISYAYSSESFHQQTSSSTFGIGADLNIGVPGATTTASLALAFSKSRITGSLTKSAMQSTSHSFYSYGEKISYKSTLNWSRMTEEAYDTYFLSECVGLGENPSDADVAQFFNNFGTHGFQEAHFGKRCTSLMIMEGTSTKEEMETWATTTNSVESTFLWFHSSTSNEIKDETEEVEEYDFTYKSSNNMCIGKVTDNGGCTTLHPVDAEEFPEILHWEYYPIWKMNIPGLTIGAKNKMKGFIESVLMEIESCGKKNCNSNGVCPVSGTVGANFNDIVDPNICICEDSYEGISCMETDVVRNFALTGTVTPGGPYDASNAIDNNKNTDTEITRYQFLQVDLKDLIKIERIVIWNWNSIFSNGSLEILDENQDILKSESFTGASASDMFDLKVQTDGVVKHVRIKTDSAVSLAEVQVYGQKIRKLDLDDKDAYKASQSTTEGKAYAIKAVDGVNKEVSCTKLQDNKKNPPHWDLQFLDPKTKEAPYEELIHQIVVWPPKKNPDLLSNCEVHVLDNKGDIKATKIIDDARKKPKFVFTFDVYGSAVQITKKKGKIAIAEVEVYVR